MPKAIKNIAFAGAGNVAWHLACGLHDKGFTISSIWSRSREHAAELSIRTGADIAESVSDLRCDSDLIVIAVTDDAIAGIADRIGGFDGIVAHTAGSVSLDILKNSTPKCGVLYPLQTFSRKVSLNLKGVPFFVEATDNETFAALKLVGYKLSGKVYGVNSKERLQLHVAAVFANNYSNFMFATANELLGSSKLPANVLKPLIRETVRKALNSDPSVNQTGPARRHDMLTIEKHLSSLAGKPELAKIYRELAEAIMNKYK